MGIKYVAFVVCFGYSLVSGAIQPAVSGHQSRVASLVQTSEPSVSSASSEPAPVVVSCTCGVFLSDQFVRGNPKPPTGYPPITRDIDEQVTCNSLGVKTCINRCVENLVSYMPSSSNLICASIDRDIFKQRAYLFVNNCNQGWFNTKFSAGREFCCKNGEYYKCPV